MTESLAAAICIFEQNVLNKKQRKNNLTPDIENNILKSDIQYTGAPDVKRLLIYFISASEQN